MGRYALVVLMIPGIAAGLVVLWKTALSRRNLLVAETRWLASSFEEQAFHALSLRYPPDRYLISAHMLLADVVGRQNLPRLSSQDQRFSWRAHCDFVIVERRSLTIVRVLEVNGPYHNNRHQQDLDARKQRLLAKFGIALETLGHHAASKKYPGYQITHY